MKIKNLYLENEIPKNWKGYFNERLSGKKYNIPEFLNGIANIYYECKTEKRHDNSVYYFIEHVYICVVSPNGNLCMLKNTNGKYWFYIVYPVMFKYQNIDYYVKNQAIKDANLVKPNFIGVFSVKKLGDWLSYCDKYIVVMEDLFNKMNTVNGDNQKTIDDFIKSLPKSDVSKWDNTTNVNTKLFRIRFRHDKSTGYLSHEITYNGSLSDITKIENYLTK